MKGCCCDCCKEKFFFADFDVGPHGGDYWPTFRGEVSGSFSEGPPAGVTLVGIPHPPWCFVRPSIVSVNAIAVAPNEGTLRVFVESTRDFATNVWAEAKTENPPFQPFVLGEHDYISDQPFLIPRDEREPSNTYEPAFGYGIESESPTGPTGPSWTPNAIPAFIFRNAEDDDAYFCSQWPVANPKTVNYGGTEYPREFRAGTLSIRCGKRQDGTDTTAASFASLCNVFAVTQVNEMVWPGELPGEGITIRLGAFVEDRLHVPETIPCGIVVEYGHDKEQSWSWPFTVPRTIITDTEQIETPRFIGLQQTATRGTSLEGTTYNAIAVGPQVVALTACAANSSAVLPALAEEDNLAVPVIAWVPTGPAVNTEITESSPYYARRSDRVLNVAHNVPHGHAWHASHVVREATSLASANQLHELDIELLPHDSGEPSVSQSFFVGTYGEGDVGLRLQLSGVDPFPWNAIAGVPYTFEAHIQGKQLFPNQWHYWSEQPQRAFSYEIETPAVSDLGETAAPASVTEENLAILNATVNRTADCRAAFKYETAVQGFAFTTLAAVPHANTLGISLADSGMASHDWDKIKRNGVHTRTPLIKLHCVFRVREKWTVTEVNGYARGWQIGTQSVTGPGGGGGTSELGGGTATGSTGSATGVAAFQQTGSVLTATTASGRDVAITEKQLAFSVDITEHSEALSAGQSVEVPLALGVHQRRIRIQLKGS